MWQSPPMGYESEVYAPRPPAKPVSVGSVVFALLLVAEVTFVPWLRWGFSVQGLGEYSSSYNLWYVVTTSGTAEALGAAWAYLVAIGVGCAVVASIVEQTTRPVSKWARGVTFGGFALAVGGCCIGLLSAASPSEGLSDFGGTVVTRLEPGFWIGLVLAGIGTILAAALFFSPPNTVRVALPFAPSPWGPPPGVMPPGFTPPTPDGWAEYVNRGQLPPGYVPPSYGPAVFPNPGYMTPAYLFPGQTGSAFGTPYVGTGAEALTGAAGEDAAASTPGRLTVLEAGKVTTMTVQPGQRLLVGRDSDAEIRVSDRKVGERHATIERRGRGWAVQDVDALKPTRLIDPWGMHRQIRGEVEIPAGQVMAGDVVITLYPEG